MVTISRNELRELLETCSGLTLVEVLPAVSFLEYHLPGAINVPLSDCFNERALILVPERSQTIVVYSLNFECRQSELATQCLLELGYQSVFDYEPGKIDWRAAKLPIEFGPSILEYYSQPDTFESVKDNPRS
ncbi:rhodanese-like domain-containing protein [Gimesia maris]|uniref:Thiosulfate:cyanide sulfurtransferase n=1 Tax=Gimesia maris TaxID=122 RepID=A0ABX5YPA8_9PLAN|nr:rhodanese-like domain-containing protein [Gimesia maris]EDL62191.1 Rhodanese-like domain protein [Gimesia maris DSM 8797]QEG17400.1 thiosulfate:cyanide sulfurtransferase [Gimesia maris]QGQ29522.1 rhodanese-like domain-containing protein [Gimesia maris]